MLLCRTIRHRQNGTSELNSNAEMCWKQMQEAYQRKFVTQYSLNYVAMCGWDVCVAFTCGLRALVGDPNTSWHIPYLQPTP